MENRIAQLEHDLETMLGAQAGMGALFVALIATHSRHQDFQLAAEMSIENLTRADPQQPLSERQREVARSFVTTMLATHPAQSGLVQKAIAAAVKRGGAKR